MAIDNVIFILFWLIQSALSVIMCIDSRSSLLIYTIIKGVNPGSLNILHTKPYKNFMEYICSQPIAIWFIIFVKAKLSICERLSALTYSTSHLFTHLLMWSRSSWDSGTASWPCRSCRGPVTRPWLWRWG